MSNAENFDKPWLIHKFGGSSVGSAEGFLRAAAIVEKDLAKGTHLIGVVVSAIGVEDGQPGAKVTDLLRNLASQDSEEKLKSLEELRQRHSTIIDSLAEKLPQHAEALKTLCKEISQVLASFTQTTLDPNSVCCFGEIWSSKILAIIVQLDFLDARLILEVTREKVGHNRHPNLSYDKSREAMARWLSVVRSFVVTGYICSDDQGSSSNLGRDGSDLSATIFARILGAHACTIWTNVEGILSGDPQSVAHPICLPTITYEEAMDISYYGSKVIHPRTVSPCLPVGGPGIPLYIRSSITQSAGTQICESVNREVQAPVSCITSLQNISVISIIGAGMIGVPGISAKVFSALDAARINVILISQGSSEYTISFCVFDKDANKAFDVCQTAFKVELEKVEVSRVVCRSECSVIGIVGESLTYNPSVTGEILTLVGNEMIEVFAIAQGSSDRIISIVVQNLSRSRAVEVLHHHFFEKPNQVKLMQSNLIRQIQSINCPDTLHRLMSLVADQAP